MNDLAADPLAHALVIAGVLLALLNARATFRGAVNTKKFLAFVRGKAEAGHFGRIRKAISHPPVAELMVLTRLWLDLDLETVVHAPAQRGYREPAEVVPLEARARAALEPYVEDRRARLGTQLPSSVAAVCLAAAGLVVGVERAWVPTLAGLAGLMAAYGGYGVWRLRRDLLTALDVLVTLPRPPTDGDELEEPPSSSGAPQRLVVRGPGGERRDFPLDTGVVKVGKLDGAQLRLEGDDVSRMHAVIEVLRDEVIIIDLGSSSGTWVNGERVNKHTLVPGDRVTIGEHEIEVFG